MSIKRLQYKDFKQGKLFHINLLNIKTRRLVSETGDIDKGAHLSTKDQYCLSKK